MKRIIIYIIFLFVGATANAQVNLKVDTTHIRIGEQIQYEISADNQGLVVFPKLQLDSLGKVELVHNLAVDTVKNKLYKKYILTSFDSGVYKIPPQSVLINKEHYLTDSLLIHVGTVAVDTTKQGLFPIKGIYKAQPKTWRDYIHYLWWVIGLLMIVALIWWLVSSVKKSVKDKAQRQLSPIEEATEHLVGLDEKQLIEQQKIKEYYVELTDIVRNYIGKDVKIPTLEVTSDELITLLQLHNKSNNLGIDKERIKELHDFLKNADLVKFAKAKPDEFQIKEDRQTAEHIITDIQKTIHKPVLDEFGNEIVIESVEEKQAKINRKRRIIGLITGVVIVLLAVLGSIAYYGFDYVKDTITGHPTKELLEGKWYRSTYGYPAVALETPKVLKAINIPLSAQTQQATNAAASFGYGSLSNGFYIIVNTNELSAEQELTLDLVVESAVNRIQNNKSISNFTYDVEDVTIDGVAGKIIKGSFTGINKKMLLTQYIFLNNNAIQQVAVFRADNDLYAKQISERIAKSIQLQKTANDDDDEN